MNPTNEKYLYDNFNFLKPVTPENFNGSYLCIGDGWFEIFKELCEKLRELDLGKFKVDMVQSKYGQLRVYYDGRGIPDDKLERFQKLLDEIKPKSASICMICSNSGSFIKMGAWSGEGLTLCTTCATKNHMR